MRLRRATALAVGLTSLGTTTPASAEAASAAVDPVERSVVKRLNAIRAQSGVRRLRTSRALSRAAHSKSGAVAATGDFSHGDVRGRLSRFVRAKSIGETLAFVPFAESGDADAVVGAWMASPSHRATLLSGRFKRIGIARRSGNVAGVAAVVFTVELASAR